jgi:predicted nucleic acid-binding protein
MTIHLKRNVLRLKKIEINLKTNWNFFRFGRKKGYTIRSSVDCLIAAIAIRENISIWHHDRDFDVLAKFTKLQVQSKF